MGLVSISLVCLKVKEFLEVLLSGVLLPSLVLMFKGDGVPCCSLPGQEGPDPHRGWLCDDPDVCHPPTAPITGTDLHLGTRRMFSGPLPVKGQVSLEPPDFIAAFPMDSVPCHYSLILGTPSGSSEAVCSGRKQEPI